MSISSPMSYIQVTENSNHNNNNNKIRHSKLIFGEPLLSVLAKYSDVFA